MNYWSQHADLFPNPSFISPINPRRCDLPSHCWLGAADSPPIHPIPFPPSPISSRHKGTLGTYRVSILPAVAHQSYPPAPFFPRRTASISSHLTTGLHHCFRSHWTKEGSGTTNGPCFSTPKRLMDVGCGLFPIDHPGTSLDSFGLHNGRSSLVGRWETILGQEYARRGWCFFCI